ncbi:MAG: IS1634 family transposase, partial [Bacteroidia bacterium]
SALFSEEGLSQIDRVNYLTRVPHTLNQAKNLLSRYQKEDFPLLENGYGWKEHRIKLFEREMRWLVVWSDQAFKRESNTLERAILKQEDRLKDALSKLKRKDFGCREDAAKAVETLVKKHRYLQLDTLEYTSKNKSRGRGRPKTEATLKQVWRVQASCKRDTELIDLKTKQLGKFILATNLLDSAEMPSQAILSHYKDQFQVEKGFRFLKSPLCLADALYLKKPQRIEALSMIMCLALMVYGLGERKIRETLRQLDETIPDQKGKPTQKPTLRWVFQCFEGITLLSIDLPEQPIQRQVLNLSVVQKQIIAIFGTTTENIYLLAFSP